MKKEMIIEIIIAVIIIGLIWSIYFGFFYYAKCLDKTCFANNVVNCKKTIYYDDTPETLMSYKILGADSGKCDVEVKLLQVKVGTSAISRLENKAMTCSIQLGTLTMPESNLQNCNGELREEIQEAMINNLHSQIVQNLEQMKISSELNETTI